MAKASLTNSVNVNDPQATAVTGLNNPPLLPTAIQVAATEAGKWLLKDIEIPPPGKQKYPKELVQFYKDHAEKIRETDIAVKKLQGELLQLEDKREKSIIVRAWNYLKGEKSFEIESETIENKVSQLDNLLTKRTLSLTAMKKLETDFVAVFAKDSQFSINDRAKLQASQVARLEAYRIQDESFVCSLLKLENGGVNSLSQATVSLVRNIVLSNEKERSLGKSQLSEAIETISQNSKDNKSQLKVLEYSKTLSNSKGYQQFTNYIRTENEFRDDSAYSIIKYDSLTFVLAVAGAVAITTFTGGLGAGVAMPLVSFFVRGAITRAIVSFGANYFATSVLMGIGTVGGEQAGKEINKLLLEQLEKLRIIDSDKRLQKGGSLISKQKELGTEIITLTYAEQVKRNVVMNMGTQVLGLGLGKLLGTIIYPIKNTASKALFGKSVKSSLTTAAKESLKRKIGSEVIEESTENVIADGADLLTRDNQLTYTKKFLSGIGLGAYADTGGTLLSALKIALTGKGLKNRGTRSIDPESDLVANDITSAVTQAQREENAQTVSQNLRQSGNLKLYGQTFKGIQSKDGKFLYLDNPLDVQKIYALAVIERAKEKNLSKETLEKALDNASGVAAFYDQRNDLIISPRASLFEDHTMRQIVSGIIRHEKAHQEGRDELGALQEQRNLYAKRGISFYLEDGELIVDKQTDSVRSSSDRELGEYVANNPSIDQLEIFTIQRGKQKLSKEQVSGIAELMKKDTPIEQMGKRFTAINQILKKANSSYDIRILINEVLEIAVAKETKQSKIILSKWGFTEKDILSLVIWLKKTLKDIDSIEAAQGSLDIILAPQKLHKLLLITKFETLETELGSLLLENGRRTREISQKTLDLLADLYQVPATEGQSRVCPASFKINLELGGFTDLPSDGNFAQKVKWIHIHNVLDANCLRELDHHLGDHAAGIARFALLDVIHRNVKARLAATNIKLQKVVLGEERVPLWNKVVRLQSKWSVSDLDDLLKKLDQAKLFELPDTDPRFGVPQTSVTINPEMNDRLWSSDACMSFLSQKVEAPHLVGRNLITNAGFILHPSNMRAATSAITDPRWYRDDPNPSQGISHIFQRNGLRWDDTNKVAPIESIMPDPAWGNNKRLESQALLLQHLVETIIAGACLGETRAELAELGNDWGFNWLGGEFPEKNEPLTVKQKEYIISSIQILASYLLSVEWDGKKYDMLAPTVSSWEEAAQPGGCASDTGFMVEAMSSLKDLLFNPAFNGNKVIDEVRESLKTKLPQFADNREGAALLGACPYADFRLVENLDNFIQAGKTLLSKMVIHPILATIDGTSVATPTGVKQFPSRGPDTSLTVLAAFYKQFDPSPARNARIRYGLVRAAKDQLMNAHPEYRLGMRRYPPFWSPDCEQWLIDSYLNYQFELGLIVPGLVKPGFAQRITKENTTISPHFTERLADGNASPRDHIVTNAHQRFCSPGTLHQMPEAKKDANTPWAMAGRQQFSLPEWVAQWTIGPTAAVIALAQAKLEILQYLETTNNFNEKPVMHLLDMVNNDLTFFINLCISTQVQKTDAEGNVILRADGTELPNELNTMEAFQAVPDVEGNDVFLPGGHTLTWSNVQLNKGLRWARYAAHKYELLREKMLGLGS